MTSRSGIGSGIGQGPASSAGSSQRGGGLNDPKNGSVRRIGGAVGASSQVVRGTSRSNHRDTNGNSVGGGSSLKGLKFQPQRPPAASKQAEVEPPDDEPNSAQPFHAHAAAQNGISPLPMQEPRLQTDPSPSNIVEDYDHKMRPKHLQSVMDQQHPISKPSKLGNDHLMLDEESLDLLSKLKNNFKDDEDE